MKVMKVMIVKEVMTGDVSPVAMFFVVQVVCWKWEYEGLAFAHGHMAT